MVPSKGKTKKNCFNIPLPRLGSKIVYTLVKVKLFSDIFHDLDLKKRRDLLIYLFSVRFGIDQDIAQFDSGSGSDKMKIHF